jgi:hypothetical protein
MRLTIQLAYYISQVTNSPIVFDKDRGADAIGAQRGPDLT